jgi:hypothetical protein
MTISPDAPDSLLTVSNVVVTAQGGHNLLSFDVTDPQMDKGPTYNRLDYVEVWGNISTFASKSFKGKGRSPISVPATQISGMQYWLRAVNRAGAAGAFFPAAAPGSSDNTLLATRSGSFGTIGTSTYSWLVPGGLMIQGGSLLVPAGGTMITYPIAFTTLLGINLTPLRVFPSPDTMVHAALQNPGTISFEIVTTDNSGVQAPGYVGWQANGFFL